MFTKENEQLICAGTYDIVVCGGGPAGFCAAVQAARCGSKVALLEKNGMLGGILTSGGNDEIALFYARGQQVISGIGWEFVQSLARSGWAHIPDFQAEHHFAKLGVRVNIPMAANLMDVFCLESGVSLHFYQPCIDVITSVDKKAKQINSVVIATKDGPRQIKGRIFIDCTGDGDIAAWAGAPYEIGDPVSKALQPATSRFFTVGYDENAINDLQLRHACDLGFSTGRLKTGDIWPEKHPNCKRLIQEHGNNVNHLYGVNGADSKSLSEAAITSHASVARVCNWLRENVEGAENAYPIALSADIGIRESRRIICEKYITAQEYLDAVQFDDAICYAYYPVDLHRNEDIQLIPLEQDQVPTIPYGAMIAKDLANLLVAGRCLSSDRLANAGLRVKAPCMAMGQAAGAAAHIAVTNHQSLRAIDIYELRQLLKKSGAIVPGQ